MGDMESLIYVSIFFHKRVFCLSCSSIFSPSISYTYTHKQKHTHIFFPYFHSVFRCCQHRQTIIHLITIYIFCNGNNISIFQYKMKVSFFPLCVRLLLFFLTLCAFFYCIFSEIRLAVADATKKSTSISKSGSKL